jgi:membrane protease YdiL (CAAX protease family)
MAESRKRLGAVLWTAAFAVLITVSVSGVWAGLLLANLKLSPAVPWSALVMAIILWMLWSFIGGIWGPTRTRDARRKLLRATPLPATVHLWAVIAGLLWVVFLAGFWAVLTQLVLVPANKLPDFSRIPIITVAATLAMAALAGAVAEEAGFRGYFQGTLERSGVGAGAVVASAVLMAPIHALTQGFVWPTILFYLLVDAMLGALAYLTQSIRPGVWVHGVGLLTFFALVWPHDKDRHIIWQHGADGWFWIHSGQALLFAILSVLALRHLVRLTRRSRVDRDNT